MKFLEFVKDIKTANIPPIYEYKLFYEGNRTVYLTEKEHNPDWKEVATSLINKTYPPKDILIRRHVLIARGVNIKLIQELENTNGYTL